MFESLVDIGLPLVVAAVAVFVCGWNKPPREVEDDE